MGYELRLREPQSLARLRFPWGSYQTSFRPNWISRGFPAEPSTPAEPGIGVPPLSNATELLASFRKLGATKLGWLRTLKNSARNWSFRGSIRRIFLKAEKSTFFSPGP